MWPWPTINHATLLDSSEYWVDSCLVSILPSQGTYFYYVDIKGEGGLKIVYIFLQGGIYELSM